MKMRRALLCCCLGSLLLACASSQPPPPPPPNDPPPVGVGPEEPPPPDVAGEADGRPSLTAEQCEASGGTVVGDIGDGATQRSDYVCANGAKPSGNISAPAGGPIGVEGSVCCPSAAAAEPPASSAPPATKIPEEWKKCSRDDECVRVDTACCDICNGGETVAVNRKHMQDAGNLRPSCASAICTKRGCILSPGCVNGSCVLRTPDGKQP